MCALPMDSQWRDLKQSEVIGFAVWKYHSGFSVEDVLAVAKGGVERADDPGGEGTAAVAQKWWEHCVTAEQWLKQSSSWMAWSYLLALHFARFEILGKLLSCFLIYKMRMLTVPTSWGCCEDLERECRWNHLAYAECSVTMSCDHDGDNHALKWNSWTQQCQALVWGLGTQQWTKQTTHS